MDSQEIKQRRVDKASSKPEPGMAIKALKGGDHPAGDVKHSGAKQLLRAFLFTIYFTGSCITIVITQFLGAPLYLVNRDLYYAYMALTKQSFGIVVTTMTQWWSPTTVRISGDESVKGQLHKTKDGRLECDFPDRMVMIANHQLYTEWLYLWWIGYANKMPMHGHIFIILKESLKYVPIIGQGMMFYGFIFMSRKWESDKPRLAHRLGKLKERHSGPLSGSQGLDPMWLLIFPEGTNLSDNGRAKSLKWAEKIGVPDMKHQLLPRSTGTYFCLKELNNTVEWVYDCTLAYEGVPHGQYGQDYFTLKSTYFEGRPPKSVNMYWRRIAVSSIPLDSAAEFDQWMQHQWRIKDDLIETYLQTGKFPPSKDLEGQLLTEEGYVETAVRAAHWWEFGKIFVVLGMFGLVANVAAKAYNVVRYGNSTG